MVEIQDKMPDQAPKGEAQGEQKEKVEWSLQKIRNKFIVMSGKGGVGKTSIAVNLSMR